MTPAEVHDEIAAYTETLFLLIDRFNAGERSGLYADVQRYADELTCMLDELDPGDLQDRVDALLDRFEALRISCLS